ncbi:MAG: imidazole glycerol phosphate synthase subunit HisH [Verrucomicrobiota bacterium]
MQTVGLIDYDRGNLRSVEKALERVGCQVVLVETRDDFARVDPQVIVLPGVGAFGDAMRNLEERDLIIPIKEWLSENRPFLGICLGYQLLFEESEESPGVEGIGYFPGKVVRFPDSVGKVPHMGWNQVSWQSDHKSALRDVFSSNPYYYHVHSYYPAVESRGNRGQCETEYGIRIISGMTEGNIAAFQFHPEKSQEAGINLLRCLFETQFSSNR